MAKAAVLEKAEEKPAAVVAGVVSGDARAVDGLIRFKMRAEELSQYLYVLAADKGHAERIYRKHTGVPDTAKLFVNQLAD